MSPLVPSRLSSLLSSRGGGASVATVAQRFPVVAAHCRYSVAASSNGKDKSNPRVITTVDSQTGIAHVVLNRPEKLNALDLPMFHAIRDAAIQVMNDSKVRVVVLRANGRAFCTGLDVPSFVTNGAPMKSFREMLERKPVALPTPSPTVETTSSTVSSDQNDASELYDAADATVQEQDIVAAVAATSNLVQDVGYLWRQVPVPVICCLHGMCFGGGLQIALGADIRIASADCKLSIMESKWGLIPDMSATVTLRELLPIDVAKDLTFTGRIVTGTEAAALGLVTHCVPVPSHDNAKESSVGTSDGGSLGKPTTSSANQADVVLKHAMTLAETIVQKNPDGLRLAKQLYQSTWVSASEEYCLQVETNFQRQLLLSWNQMAAAGRNYGWKLPYFTKNSKIVSNNVHDILQVPKAPENTR
jgi:enoyl-CoA hydratase/carnithine racemase